VTDAEEEEVFNESNGGHGNMNAYWTVYVDEDTADDMSKVNLNTYKTNEVSVLDTTHPYSARLSGPLNMLVEEDNLKFREEIIDW
jgi:precorrin-6x reductase